MSQVAGRRSCSRQRSGRGRQPGPAARGPAAAARRRWPACGGTGWPRVLLAAGLVLRVLAQLAYRPALFYIDTTRYLYNARRAWTRSATRGRCGRSCSSANFDAVAAVQHLLGLAMAVVLYVLLLRRGVPRWLAALAMAPVLLDAYQLQIEQMIMPDAWFEALIVAGLAILLWPPRPPAGGGSWWPAWCWAPRATVAQVGEALLPCRGDLPAGGRRRLAARRLRQGGGAVLRGRSRCRSWPTAPARCCSPAPSPCRTPGITSFYGRTAAAADCATLRLPAGERAMCPAPAQQAQGPDWLEYAPASPVRPYYRTCPGPRWTPDRPTSTTGCSASSRSGWPAPTWATWSSCSR